MNSIFDSYIKNDNQKTIDELVNFSYSIETEEDYNQYVARVNDYLVEVAAKVENKGNPYRAKDGRFTFGPSKAKDSSKPKMTASQALYSYQDYGYRDINDYLRLSDKKNLDDYDKKRLGEITGDSSRLNKVKEHIEAIDSAFSSDKAKTGGSGHRIDTGIATDIFSSTEIGDTVNKLKEENLLPENHTEWYDTKVEGAKRLEDAVKNLVGTNYKFKSYVSTDAEKSSAYDEFSQGNTGISSLGMETYIQISSNRVKTLRVNDFTGMDSHMGQDNPENEILFNRNSTFEIYHATIKPTSAEGYSGPRGEGFQLVLYMKDPSKSNNSADDKFDNSGYNPYRDPKSGQFTDAPFSTPMVESGTNRSRIEAAKSIESGGTQQAKLSSDTPQQDGSSGYMTGHTAPINDGDNPNGENIEEYMPDIYTDMAERLYRYDDYDSEGIEIAKRMHENPNEPVKIYRAVPNNESFDTISTGDWITTVKEYADIHGKGNINGDYKILEAEVLPREIWTDGNSIVEWGYDPR